MLNLLCATDSLGWTITLIVLIALMVVYLIFGTINRKKAQEQAMKMLSDLKKGDKIVTNAGIYGEIVSQKETNMGKIVVIKTGEDGGKASYITINASVILGIDTKEDLILDEQGNVIEPEEIKEKVMNNSLNTTEQKVEENKEEKEEKEETDKKTTKKKKDSEKKVTSKKAKTATN